MSLSFERGLYDRKNHDPVARMVRALKVWTRTATCPRCGQVACESRDAVEHVCACTECGHTVITPFVTSQPTPTAFKP